MFRNYVFWLVNNFFRNPYYYELKSCYRVAPVVMAQSISNLLLQKTSAGKIKFSTLNAQMLQTILPVISKFLSTCKF